MSSLHPTATKTPSSVYRPCTVKFDPESVYVFLEIHKEHQSSYLIVTHKTLRVHTHNVRLWYQNRFKDGIAHTDMKIE